MENVAKVTVFDRMMLTEFLFDIVAEYLISCSIDLNNLLNVSRNLRQLKHSKFYWKLNKVYSLQYYMDIDYKASLDLLIGKPLSQLSLALTRLELGQR
jgi:hypothetical protein